jgi:ABC-type phosphate transport system substrate-binding protein
VVTVPASALLLYLATGGPPAAAQEPARLGSAMAIVVHRSNPVEELSLAELRSLFLGERQRWPNGRRVTLVLPEAGQPEGEAAVKLIYRMTEAELNHHFLRAVYRGQALGAPKRLASADRVVRFVFNVPGAIGCIPAQDVDGSVKVLKVEGWPPGEPGYPLRLP